MHFNSIQLLNQLFNGKCQKKILIIHYHYNYHDDNDNIQPLTRIHVRMLWYIIFNSYKLQEFDAFIFLPSLFFSPFQSTLSIHNEWFHHIIIQNKKNCAKTPFKLNLFVCLFVQIYIKFKLYGITFDLIFQQFSYFHHHHHQSLHHSIEKEKKK